VNNVQGTKLRTIVPLCSLNMIVQLTYTLDAIIPKTGGSLEMLFILAVYWSLGAGLLEESQEKFDYYCRELSEFPQVVDKTERLAKLGTHFFIKCYKIAI